MRKWQILDIALTHFIRYGFYGTSTRKIAEEAGISSGLMFHYFPNKLALYEALVDIGCEPMTVEVSEDESPLVFFEKQVEWFLSVHVLEHAAAAAVLLRGRTPAKDCLHPHVHFLGDGIPLQLGGAQLDL